MIIGTFFNIIKYVSALSILIPFIFCIIKYKTLNKVLRVLFLYVIASAFTEGIGFYLLINNIHTYRVQNLFTLIECTFITYIYYIKFERINAKRVITIFYLFYAILSYYLLVVKQGYNKQDNILNTMESAFFMALAYSYFYNLTRELDISKLTEYYFTWLNSAFLIYFSSGFVMFLFKEYIENLHLQYFYLVYCLYLIASIAYNIILSIGIWKIKRN